VARTQSSVSVAILICVVLMCLMCCVIQGAAEQSITSLVRRYHIDRYRSRYLSVCPAALTCLVHSSSSTSSREISLVLEVLKLSI